MSFKAVRNHILGKFRDSGSTGSSTSSSSSTTTATSTSTIAAATTTTDSEENFAGRYSHLTSACKSDLFMLQMRRDKLNRVLSQHNCAPAKKQFANNSVTLGEADIQGVLRENVTVERILARRKLRDRDEAVTSLSIAADLDDVVNSKLFELQQTCASGLRAAQASSGVPKFALSKPAGSKRRQVLSVLSLLEQWTELFKPLMVNAQLAASMPSVSQGDKKVGVWSLFCHQLCLRQLAILSYLIVTWLAVTRIEASPRTTRTLGFKSRHSWRVPCGIAHGRSSKTPCSNRSCWPQHESDV